MKKVRQKIYSKFLSLSLALSGVFSFSANAEPFPPGRRWVYRVAVVGGRFEDNNPVPVEYREGLNKEVIDKHCECGMRVTKYDGVERHGDGRVWLGSIEISENTILTGTGPGDQIFSFLDFSKKQYDLKHFQFAICPFETNPDEDMEELKGRMIRLTEYLKSQNEMLGIAFMPIIDDSKHDEGTVERFGDDLERFVAQVLARDYDVYQQEVHIYQVRTTNPRYDYYKNHLFNGMLQWSGARRKNYKEFIGKDVPCFDPVHPGLAPKGSKKKVKQSGSDIGACRDFYSRYFNDLTYEGSPLGYESFREALESLLSYGLDKEDIIGILKTIKFNQSCLVAKIGSELVESRAVNSHSSSSSDILSVYDYVFKDEGVENAFVWAFEDCSGSRDDFDTIENALNARVKIVRRGSTYYLISEKINVPKNGFSACGCYVL